MNLYHIDIFIVVLSVSQYNLKKILLYMVETYFIYVLNKFVMKKVITERGC